MFDFIDSDWFVIGLEIVFLVLIIYDIKRYMETKKREYIINIVMTVGFAIWVLLPYYKSYFTWDESKKQEIIFACNSTKEVELCKCINETSFKTYTYEEYVNLDLNTSDYKEFLKETKEDCLDDGWF